MEGKNMEKGGSVRDDGDQGKQGGNGDHHPTHITEGELEEGCLDTRKEDNISQGGGDSTGDTVVGDTGGK